MSHRDQPNLIALGCAIAFLLSAMFLPFYQILTFGLNGWTLMQYNAIMCLPLVMGVLMALASALFDVRVSIGTGIASLVVVFILMLVGRSLLLNGNAVASLLTSTVSQTIGFNLSAALPLTIGIGGILSILFAVVFIVVEVLMASPRPNRQPVDKSDWDF